MSLGPSIIIYSITIIDKINVVQTRKWNDLSSMTSLYPFLMLQKKWETGSKLQYCSGEMGINKMGNWGIKMGNGELMKIMGIVCWASCYHSQKACQLLCW